jgi:hypothetical protein
MHFSPRVLILAMLIASTAASGTLIPDTNTNTSVTAFAATFVRRDSAVIESVNARAVQWVLNLMDKQDIPKTASAMRELSDVKLICIGMRAAVSGISHWRREANTDRIIVNDDTG